MSDNNVKTLSQVYAEDCESCHSLVVKHYPVEWSEEDVQRFVTMVTRSEVSMVCIPVAQCDVAVAVLPETQIVYDKQMERWQDRAFRNPSEDCYTIFEFLGEPSGIFIANVPAGINCDMLSLYFENSRSGGIEGTVVEPLEEGDILDKKYAVITISDRQAIKSILSKQNHVINQTALEISPFYPSVHRYILETVRNRGNEEECRYNVNAESVDIDDSSNSHDDQELIVNLNAESVDIDDSSNSHGDQELIVNEKSEPCEQEIEETDDKIVIVYSGNPSKPENNDIEVSPPDFRSSNTEKRWFCDDNNGAGRIVGTVQPMLRDSTHLENTGGGDSYEDPKCTKTSVTEEDVNLPPYKIHLLIKFRFKETHESETLKICYKPEEGTVTLSGSSFEEFKTVRNKMLSCFDDINSKFIKLDTSKYKLLSSENNMAWILSKLEQKNIRVSLVTDDNTKKIICYSLNDIDANKGIELIEECIVSITIPVPEARQTLLDCREWCTLKQSLEDDKTLVSVSHNGKAICIYSLDDSEADEARLKVNKYLSKQSIVKKEKEKVATVDLVSGKARCFKESVEGRLRQEIQKRNGSLRVEEMSRNKIQVSCDGSDDVANLFTWHERVDFNKLSETDTGIIMKALDGHEGKAFVRKFENNLHCCIEISKEGEKVIQKPRIVVKDLFESSSDEESDQAAANIERVPDVREEHNPRSYSARGRSRWTNDRFSAFQSGLSEEEELQKALELSMQSSRSTSPVRELNEEYDSDSSLSEETIDPYDQTVNKTQDEVLYSRVRPDSDDCRPKQRRDTPHVPTMTIAGTTVKVVKGAVAKQKADVLVNIVSSGQSAFNGTIARSFLDIGGHDLLEMYMDGECSTDIGNVVTKSSGLLRCSEVIHVKLKRTDDVRKIVQCVVRDVLSYCQKFGAKDIAFPPLGVGNMFSYKPEQVAQAMLSEIRVQLSKGRTSMKDISIFIVGDGIYEIFQKQLQTLDTTESEHRGKRSFNDGFKPRGDQNQRQWQRRGSDRQVHRGPHNHSGSRASSNSSSNSRESSDRKRHFEDPKNGDDHARRQRQDRRSNADKCTVPDLNIRIIAANKDACITAKKAFCTKVKEKFLHEETVDKLTQRISKSSKDRIVRIISTNDIMCINGKENYKLKGMKKHVKTAHSEILKVLLEEKNALENKRKLKHKTKRETFEFVKVMTEEEPEAPNYWKNYKEGETFFQSFKRLVGKKCEKVELDKGSRQYKCILKMMNETFDPRFVGQGADASGLEVIGHNSLHVLKIERLENFVLYEQYVKRRQTLYRTLFRSKQARFPKLDQIPHCSGPIVTSKYVKGCLDGDLHPEINEVLLFHSTLAKRVNVICNDGFDSRLGSGEAMFGQGIYGAEKAMKADQYADDKGNRSKGPLKMFLIRMLLGNGYLCTANNPHKYKRPPCTRCSRDDCSNHFHERGKFGRFYDSVIGDNKKLFREFVVYENSLCYPEYLITYERR